MTSRSHHHTGSPHIRLEMNKRSTYLNRACLVFCGGHFEFLIRARSASARSGTEITENRSELLGPCHFIIIGERSDPPRICESQTSKISVPDLAQVDRAIYRTARLRARIKNSKWPPHKNKTHAVKVG